MVSPKINIIKVPECFENYNESSLCVCCSWSMDCEDRTSLEQFVDSQDLP